MSVLREVRVDRGLSLRGLAYFAECSHTTIARLERGEIDVSPSLKARIAKVLRVPVSQLWTLEVREPGFDRARGSRNDNQRDQLYNTPRPG